jgi:hypothetical protein
VITEKNQILEQQKEEISAQHYKIAKQKKLVDIAYHRLHDKNQEVLDSIRYARRIQQALLTNEWYIEKHLKRLMQ